jgi:hypothetical protein
MKDLATWLRDYPRSDDAGRRWALAAIEDAAHGPELGWRTRFLGEQCVREPGVVGAQALAGLAGLYPALRGGAGVPPRPRMAGMPVLDGGEAAWSPRLPGLYQLALSLCATGPLSRRMRGIVGRAPDPIGLALGAVAAATGAREGVAILASLLRSDDPVALGWAAEACYPLGSASPRHRLVPLLRSGVELGRLERDRSLERLAAHHAELDLGARTAGVQEGHGDGPDVVLGARDRHAEREEHDEDDPHTAPPIAHRPRMNRTRSRRPMTRQDSACDPSFSGPITRTSDDSTAV